MCVCVCACVCRGGLGYSLCLGSAQLMRASDEAAAVARTRLLGRRRAKSRRWREESEKDPAEEVKAEEEVAEVPEKELTETEVKEKEKHKWVNKGPEKEVTVVEECRGGT